MANLRHTERLQQTTIYKLSSQIVKEVCVHNSSNAYEKFTATDSVYFRLCSFQPFSHLVWIWHPVAILSYPVIIFSKMVYAVLTGMIPSGPYFSSVEKCYVNNDREKRNLLLVSNHWHVSLCIWTICLHKIEYFFSEEDETRAHLTWLVSKTTSTVGVLINR